MDLLNFSYVYAFAENFSAKRALKE